MPTQPFNFLQFGESGAGTGITPFWSTGPFTGFVQFYTPQNVLDSVTSGNFPLFSDFTYNPPSLTSRVTGEIKSNNPDKPIFIFGFYGNIYPLNKEDASLSESFTGVISGDNLDKPLFFTPFLGTVTGDNVDRPNFIAAIYGDTPISLSEKYYFSTNFYAGFTGDNIDRPQFTTSFTGKFYQSLKDKASVSVVFTAITISKGNIKVIETGNDTANITCTFSKIIWSA